MNLSPRVRCLGGELSEYVAGRLPAERQWEWDRHLVACRLCGEAVESERRIRSALSGAPSMPGDLRITLLALGSAMAAEAPARTVPVSGREPLALLAPSAPACHRSPLRATVVAAAAAGVSAAAAWSLTVIGPPVLPRTDIARPTTPAVRPATAPTTAAVVTARLEVRSALTRPAPVSDRAQRAQSTP